MRRHLFIEKPEHLAVPFTISYHRYRAGQDTKSSQFESTDRTNRFWRFRDQQKNHERQLESVRRAENARRVEEADRQWRAELERERREREEAERDRERERRRARREGELEAARLARLEEERERRIATENILRQLRQEQKRRHQLQLDFVKEYERERSRTSLDEGRQNRRAHSRYKGPPQRNSHKKWKFWDRGKREKFDDKNDEIAAIDSIIKRLRREHKRLLREEIEYEKKYERAQKKTIAAHARAEAKSRGVGKSKITFTKPSKQVKRHDEEQARYDKGEKEAEKKIKAREKARRKHEERKAKSEQKRKARSEGKQKEKERELMILERKRSREEAQRRALEKKQSDREEKIRVIQEMRERRQLLKEKIEAEKYRRRYQKPRPERKVAIREYRTTTLSERIWNSFYRCCCKLYCASILALVGLFFIIVV